MKTATKRFGSLLLASSLVLSLAACGGEPAVESQAPAESGAAVSAAAGDEPIKLTWAVWDINLTTYYQPLIDAYEAAHPNVTIEMVDVGSSDYSNQLTIQLSGGTDYDVVCVKDIPGYSSLVNGGYLSDLSGEGIDESLYNGTIDQIKVDGKFYAVPFRSDHWVVYYNKDVFDKAGVEYPSNDMTVEEYDALARELTSGEGSDKVYGDLFHTWRSAPTLFSILDGEHTIVDGNYDFLKPTYEWVLKEQQDGICMDYGTMKATQTHYSGVFFNNQCAMMNMGSWFIPTQIEKVKSGESLSANWGIAKYPHPDGVEAGTTLGTITSVAVNAKSEKQDAAKDFVKFVSGEEGAEIIAGTGTFPAIKNDKILDTLSAMDGFPTDENSKEALSTTKVYLEMPMHDKAAEIENILNEAHDGIMTGTFTIDEGIKKMNDEVGALLGQ